MILYNWNANHRNKKIKKGIDWILEQKPDIICLQEIPYSIIDGYLSKLGMHLTYTHDYTSKVDPNKDTYLVTLTTIEPDEKKEYTYFDEKINSILKRVHYEKISKVIENHLSSSISLNVQGKKLDITNLHLSCSTGSKKRLMQLKNVLDLLDTTSHNILCGDFNIVTNKLLKNLKGIITEYTREDYRINESRELQTLLEKYSLKNIFAGHPTFALPTPKIFGLQLDYVQVDSRLNVTNHATHKSFGSDHKILSAQIDL